MRLQKTKNLNKDKYLNLIKNLMYKRVEKFLQQNKKSEN